MLSKASLRAIYLSIRILCMFRAGPFEWNQQDQKLLYSTKKSTRIGFYLITIFVPFHFSFVLFRAVQSFLFLNASPAKFLLQLALVGQASLSLSCQLNTFFQQTETANFVTSFLHHEQYLTSKYCLSKYCTV